MKRLDDLLRDPAALMKIIGVEEYMDLVEGLVYYYEECNENGYNEFYEINYILGYKNFI